MSGSIREIETRDRDIRDKGPLLTSCKLAHGKRKREEESTCLDLAKLYRKEGKREKRLMSKEIAEKQKKSRSQRNFCVTPGF